MRLKIRHKKTRPPAGSGFYDYFTYVNAAIINSDRRKRKNGDRNYPYPQTEKQAVTRELCLWASLLLTRQPSLPALFYFALAALGAAVREIVLA